MSQTEYKYKYLTTHCLEEYWRQCNKKFEKKNWEKILDKRNKAGALDVIAEKMGNKVRSTKEDTEGHYTMIKGKIYEEDIKVIKLHVPGR